MAHGRRGPKRSDCRGGGHVWCTASSGSFAFLLGALELLVVEHGAFRVCRAEVGLVEPQGVHLGRRLLSTCVEELGGVVVACALDRLGAGDDVVHEVEREVVGLFVVASGGDLADGSLDDDAAVEGGGRSHARAVPGSRSRTPIAHFDV